MRLRVSGFRASAPGHSIPANDSTWMSRLGRQAKVNAAPGTATPVVHLVARLYQPSFAWQRRLLPRLTAREAKRSPEGRAHSGNLRLAVVDFHFGWSEMGQDPSARRILNRRAWASCLSTVAIRRGRPTFGRRFGTQGNSSSRFCVRRRCAGRCCHRQGRVFRTCHELPSPAKKRLLCLESLDGACPGARSSCPKSTSWLQTIASVAHR